MHSVREKLLDPQFHGFFVPFSKKPTVNGSYHSPPCDHTWNPPRCSSLYHDQWSTPQFNSTHPDPVRAGVCGQPCDCGVACGEYIFDHRNGSMLQNWLVDEYIGGADGTGNKNISGVFIDDFWCSDPAPPLLPSVPYISWMPLAYPWGTQMKLVH